MGSSFFIIIRRTSVRLYWIYDKSLAETTDVCLNKTFLISLQNVSLFHLRL